MSADRHHPGQWFILSAVLLALGGAGGIYFGWYPIYRERKRMFAEMDRYAHPVWKELADGKTRAGDSLDDVLARHRAWHVDNITDGGSTWRLVQFLPDTVPWHHLVIVSVASRDGRIIGAQAEGDGWHYRFIKSDSDDWARLRFLVRDVIDTSSEWK